MGSKQTKGLGRGLNALIPNYDDSGNEKEKNAQLININYIKSNANQPRKIFDPDKLRELSESIKTHGLIQPILLRADGNYYSIVAGERRYRASVLAGLKEIPAIVKELSDKEVMQIALIENIQREDLTDIEEAAAYKELKENFSMSQEQIAGAVGKSRAAVANTLRLLQLPEKVQNHISSGRLSAGHARAVLALESEDLREEFADYIIKNELTVRQAEKQSKDYGGVGTKKTRPEPEPRMSHILQFEEGLSKILGTKVIIKTNAKNKRGKIEIEYYNHDDLARLLEKLSEGTLR